MKPTVPEAPSAWSAAQRNMNLNSAPGPEPESATFGVLNYAQNYYNHLFQTFAPGSGTELQKENRLLLGWVILYVVEHC